MRLKGKTALVTGGSRGIGRQICISLAKEGADIVLTYRSEETRAKDLVKELSSLAPGSLAQAYQCDVRSRDDVQRVKAAVEEVVGNLDVLVNNAGINKPTDFDEISDGDWDEILSTNLKGPFIVSQEFLPLLAKSEESSIINIGSVSGQYGGPRTAHYAASKAGLISLGQVIARFGAPQGIRCNTLAAGIVASEMGEDGLKATAVAQAAESILLKRLGTYEEIARAVVFLACNDSSYVTGQTINVNGGIYF